MQLHDKKKNQMAELSVFLRLMVVLGSLNAAAAVILGAFGAHALETTLTSESLAVFSTAVQYHLYHALGLCAVAMVALIAPESMWSKASGWSMVAGIILFSGSLYALSLSGIRWFGMITPIGGILLIVSWLLLAIGALRGLSGKIVQCANRPSAASNCR